MTHASTHNQLHSAVQSQSRRVFQLVQRIRSAADRHHLTRLRSAGGCPVLVTTHLPRHTILLLGVKSPSIARTLLTSFCLSNFTMLQQQVARSSGARSVPAARRRVVQPVALLSGLLPQLTGGGAKQREQRKEKVCP